MSIPFPPTTLEQSQVIVGQLPAPQGEDTSRNLGSNAWDRFDRLSRKCSKNAEIAFDSIDWIERTNWLNRKERLVFMYRQSWHCMISLSRLTFWSEWTSCYILQGSSRSLRPQSSIFFGLNSSFWPLCPPLIIPDSVWPPLHPPEVPEGPKGTLSF